MIIEILRVSDGAVRSYLDESPWGIDCEFMWSEGNYSCDCNRAKFFHKGEHHATECGDVAYLVRITDDTGKELYADDEWPEAEKSQAQ